jgi:hypothetical protein
MPELDGRFTLVVCPRCGSRSIGFALYIGSTEQQCAICYRLIRITVTQDREAVLGWKAVTSEVRSFREGR